MMSEEAKCHHTVSFSNWFPLLQNIKTNYLKQYVIVLYRNNSRLNPTSSPVLFQSFHEQSNPSNEIKSVG